MEVKNNPAGRLHDILNEARGKSPKTSMRNVWATVFGIDPNDTALLLKMLAELIDLVHDSKSAIKRLDDVDHQLHLRPFTKIEGFLSKINFDASWEAWRNQIDEATLYGLQFSADRLSRVAGTSRIPGDELDQLRANVDELLSLVEESHFESDLKLLLLRNLDAIRQSIVAYKIKGLDGIQREIERAYGSVVLHRDLIKDSNDEERTAWKGFFELIDRMNKLVTLAKSGKELAAPVIRLVLENLK